ncbi:Fe(3+) dicitrate ABC transporter substrate-binding protein [Paenibacillus sp. GD4]|jgi:ferric citrate transport system substrate-binding protein|uniref:ABC transporter substrate-binding protein n=1 Tax=Paenibacillus sp. GD4 TaxID=3068890 RepID=UPI0027967DCB|nr:Fe(3+) dicitrate ABC transporter substrate-binding protein [Paenibacillus sp. GD4]MDQ1914903.1 Fe(3+) dicitrate ABC transporter substrate-binding protein [Paenibacillus sp. GD4]
MKRQAWIYLFLSLFIVLAGCGKSVDTNAKGGAAPADPAKAGNQEVRTVKHELGETKLQGVPKRIVALEFSFVDALATFGVSPVGVADDGDANNIIEPIKQKIQKYTSLGSRYEVNFELIASVKPDLIIADVSRHKEVYGKLEQIAPTIELKSLGSDYNENMASFHAIADALGMKAEAEKRLKEHQAALEQLKKQIPAGEKRTVLPAVVTAAGFFAHTSKAYAGSVLEQLGLKDAIQSNDAYPKITLEQLVSANPEVLFLMVNAGEKTVLDEWKKNPLWSQIPAVKNGQIYEVDRKMWSLSRGLISAETIGGNAIQLLYGQKK